MFTLILPAFLSASVVCQQPRAVDGDTIRCAAPLDASGARKIRVWGLDAPELAAEGGLASKAGLARLLDGQAAITCSATGKPSYGRVVALCVTIGGVDLARAQIEAGLAREWCRFSAGFYGRCRKGAK